jgi:hypothetical protein
MRLLPFSENSRHALTSGGFFRVFPASYIIAAQDCIRLYYGATLINVQ